MPKGIVSSNLTASAKFIMDNKKLKYIEKYYLNNYADGDVDKEIEAVGSFIAKESAGRVLDCGCGPVPQIYAIFMPQMKELYAIDLPQESIDFVKEKIALRGKWYQTFLPYQKVVESIYGVQPESYILKQIEKIKDIQQADMTENLPFPDEYFDTVISFYSLGCLNNEEELNKAIYNIKRVLKTGGKLLHINTNGKNSNNELPAYTWRGLDQTSKLIKKYLKNSGFNIISEKQVDLFPNKDSMYTYSNISLLKAEKL